MLNLQLKHSPLDTLRDTSEFGQRVPPKAGASPNHKGIDLGANTEDFLSPTQNPKAESEQINSGEIVTIASAMEKYLRN